MIKSTSWRSDEVKFKILYGDPNWAYQNWTKKKNGAAAAHYDCSSTEEICAWPVHEIADEDSLLFLWATLPKLPDALQVMVAWGFTYVSTAFVWAKQNKSGEGWFFGPGFWTRSNSELVLMGRRGRGLSRVGKSVAQLVVAPMQGHSRKPAEVRRRIVNLVGDFPRVELFARRHEGEDLEAEGWSATGLEYDGRTLVEAIEYFKNQEHAFITARVPKHDHL